MQHTKMSSDRITRLMKLIIVAISLPLHGGGGNPTTGKFHDCPPEGIGGDPDLNALKNRDVAPTAYEDFSLRQFLDNKAPTATAMGKRNRSKWTAEAKQDIADWEAKGARVEGRLIAVRSQGPEACNCKSSTDVDFHIWIATNASADAKPTQSMVVEISPRGLGDHPGWTKSNLVALSKVGARVRINGWITWDDEHGSEVGKSRGTLWEIHPIHKIEAFAHGKWVDIDHAGGILVPPEEAHPLTKHPSHANGLKVATRWRKPGSLVLGFSAKGH